MKTLRRMATVDRYNRWVFEKLAGYLGDRVLEVGCGIGNMTPFLVCAQHVTCIDLLPESVALVRKQFESDRRVHAFVTDIADPESVAKLGQSRYDTVVCINVLEHIEHHVDALRHMHDVLIPGGRILLFVPAGRYLYGRLDEALGHYRRYTLDSLCSVVRTQGFDIVEASYMNVAGIPGWFLSSRILRREAPPRGLLRLFNFFTPLFIWLETRLRPPFGQSIICVARRVDERPEPYHN
ncbi:MAG TPA: class I SAM-dependent methyltransferase [Chloroflexota bacterium]|nr:class I SAM-dependent methyltransferase [Chloroflexota bacterium]